MAVVVAGKGEPSGLFSRIPGEVPNGIDGAVFTASAYNTGEVAIVVHQSNMPPMAFRKKSRFFVSGCSLSKIFINFQQPKSWGYFYPNILPNKL